MSVAIRVVICRTQSLPQHTIKRCLESPRRVLLHSCSLYIFIFMLLSAEYIDSIHIYNVRLIVIRSYTNVACKLLAGENIQWQYYDMRIHKLIKISTTHITIIFPRPRVWHSEACHASFLRAMSLFLCVCACCNAFIMIIKDKILCV